MPYQYISSEISKHFLGTHSFEHLLQRNVDSLLTFAERVLGCKFSEWSLLREGLERTAMKLTPGWNRQ
jgi:hypothetical protein